MAVLTVPNGRKVRFSAIEARDNFWRMTMQDSLAVTIALAHIDAWSRHDWDKTKELLALVAANLPASTITWRGR
jgi:ABC-type Fe3+ transport system substrate-binding protein